MTPAFLEQYRACFETTWSGDEPIDAVRFVVLDSETTGLNPATDRLVTIGAVAVQGGEIVLDDSFSALLQVERNTEVGHGARRHARRGAEGRPGAGGAWRGSSTICATA